MKLTIRTQEKMEVVAPKKELLKCIQLTIIMLEGMFLNTFLFLDRQTFDHLLLLVTLTDFTVHAMKH